ncbi:shTK domain protein, partial [Oesophagostomum dentatum]
YCQAACNFCSNSAFGSIWNTQTCSDGNSSCRTWAARGECNNNRVYMWENCRQSCQACSIGMLSTRLTSCGFSRQVRSRRQPISEFRIKPEITPIARKSALLSRRPLSLAPAPSRTRAQEGRRPLKAPRQSSQPLQTRKQTLNRIQRRGFNHPKKDISALQKLARAPRRQARFQRPRSHTQSRRRTFKRPARPTGKLVLPQRKPVEVVAT